MHPSFFGVSQPANDQPPIGLSRKSCVRHRRFERLFNIFALVFGMIFFSSLISSLSATMVPWQAVTFQGTNISPEKSILKMIFLFPRWDMLISWRVPSYLPNFFWGKGLPHGMPWGIFGGCSWHDMGDFEVNFRMKSTQTANQQLGEDVSRFWSFFGLVVFCWR